MSKTLPGHASKVKCHSLTLCSLTIIAFDSVGCGENINPQAVDRIGKLVPMNDDEKELLKVGAETAMKPFADLISTLFGGSVEEIGGTWKDRFAVRRQIRRIKLFQKLQAAIDEAGYQPIGIPDNIWAPAIQEASLQDDDSIQEKWANLLANAADPRAGNEVLPSFVAILKELTPAHATLLMHCYEDVHKKAGPTPKLGITGVAYEMFELKRMLDAPNIVPGKHTAIAYGNDFMVLIEVLKTHGILTEKLGPNLRRTQVRKFSFSELGIAFVRACQAPRPK
jgi:hypothetical protein